jgi:hypothetical protein
MAAINASAAVSDPRIRITASYKRREKRGDSSAGVSVETSANCASAGEESAIVIDGRLLPSE